MTNKKLFDYQKPSENQVEAISKIRNKFKELFLLLEDELIDGRMKTNAITKLEESSMWANKSIVFEEIEEGDE